MGRRRERVTTRKYQGDDAYSWAVFVDGRPVDTGLSQREARAERDRHRRRLAGGSA